MTPTIPFKNTPHEIKILVESINDINFTLEKIADWLENIYEKDVIYVNLDPEVTNSIIQELKDIKTKISYISYLNTPKKED